MSNYIQFTGLDGHPILIEVDAAEVTVTRGAEKAGLKETAQKAASTVVAVAQDSFANTLERIIIQNAQVIARAIQQTEIRPSEVEVAFGIRMTGEAGNVAVCKAGGEANYTVKLVWKQSLP
jgi:hypothetical protein